MQVSKKILNSITKSEEKSSIIDEMMEKNLDVRYLLKYIPNFYQMIEISIGLENGLGDLVNKYAKPEFNYAQMKQIRLGLENGLENLVDKYAKPEFDSFQMEQIRIGLEHGLGDLVDEYAKVGFDYDKMIKIRRKLEASKKQLKASEKIKNYILKYK